MGDEEQSIVYRQRPLPSESMKTWYYRDNVDKSQNRWANIRNLQVYDIYRFARVPSKASLTQMVGSDNGLYLEEMIGMFVRPCPLNPYAISSSVTRTTFFT